MNIPDEAVRAAMDYLTTGNLYRGELADYDVRATLAAALPHLHPTMCPECTKDREVQTYCLECDWTWDGIQ